MQLQQIQLHAILLHAIQLLLVYDKLSYYSGAFKKLVLDMINYHIRSHSYINNGVNNISNP